MSSAIDVVVVQVTPEMIHNWVLFPAFGIVLLLLGVAAVVRSVSARVASMVFFGWLLVFAGLIEFVDAFMVGQWAGFFPAHAGSDPLWNYRLPHGGKAGHKRRGGHLLDVDVLSVHWVL